MVCGLALVFTYSIPQVWNVPCGWNCIVGVTPVLVDTESVNMTVEGLCQPQRLRNRISSPRARSEHFGLTTG